MEIYNSENILYCDDNYHIKLYFKDKRYPTIIGFSTREEKYKEKLDFNREFAKSAILSMNFNYVSFVTNENCWYQNQASLAICSINKVLRDFKGQIVTYGCSMGGFAAVHFSKSLNATFLAFSPQASLSSLFMSNINDKRWSFESSKLAPFNSDILSGANAATEGYVFFDSSHIDGKHALVIMDKTLALGCDLKYSGHGSVSGLNSTYGLKKLMKDIYIENLPSFDVLNGVVKKWENSLEFLAGGSYDDFFDLLIINDFKLSPIAFRNVLKGFESGIYPIKFNLYIPTIIENNSHQHKVALEKLKKWA